VTGLKSAEPENGGAPAIAARMSTKTVWLTLSQRASSGASISSKGVSCSLPSRRRLHRVPVAISTQTISTESQHPRPGVALSLSLSHSFSLCRPCGGSRRCGSCRAGDAVETLGDATHDLLFVRLVMWFLVSRVHRGKASLSRSRKNKTRAEAAHEKNKK
jgi:hypothetical protein